VKMGAVMKRSILGGLRILLALAACGLVVFAASDAWAQQKQKLAKIFVQSAAWRIKIHSAARH
jgi:hypothetical protein